MAGGSTAGEDTSPLGFNGKLVVPEFGIIASLSSITGTVVVISFLVFLVGLESIFHMIEHAAENRGFSGLYEKVKSECSWELSGGGAREFLFLITLITFLITFLITLVQLMLTHQFYGLYIRNLHVGQSGRLLRVGVGL